MDGQKMKSSTKAYETVVSFDENKESENIQMLDEVKYARSDRNPSSLFESVQSDEILLTGIDPGSCLLPVDSMKDISHQNGGRSEIDGKAKRLMSVKNHIAEHAIMQEKQKIPIHVGLWKMRETKEAVEVEAVEVEVEAVEMEAVEVEAVEVEAVEVEAVEVEEVEAVEVEAVEMSIYGKVQYLQQVYISKPWVEKMEGDTIDAALTKNKNVLALLTENGRKKTFLDIPAIADFVNVSELIRWGFYLDIDPTTAQVNSKNEEEVLNIIVCCAFCNGKGSLKSFVKSEPGQSIRSRYRRFPPGYDAYATPLSVYQRHKEINWMCPLLTGEYLPNVEFSFRALSRCYPDDDEDFNPNRRKLLGYKTRFQSFEFFPKKFIVSVHELARWGLYYTGIRDETACIFCRVILHNWEFQDSPYEEHRRFSPNCPLIKGRNVMDISYDDPLKSEVIKEREEKNRDVLDAITDVQSRRSRSNSFKSDPDESTNNTNKQIGESPPSPPSRNRTIRVPDGQVVLDFDCLVTGYPEVLMVLAQEVICINRKAFPAVLFLGECLGIEERTKEHVEGRNGHDLPPVKRHKISSKETLSDLSSAAGHENKQTYEQNDNEEDSLLHKASTSSAGQSDDRNTDRRGRNEEAEYCPLCARGPFRYHFNLNQHFRDVHLGLSDSHPRLHPVNQVGGGSDIQRVGRFTLVETAANRTAENYVFDPVTENLDPESFIMASREHLLDFFSKYFQQINRQALKVQVVLSVHCHRFTLEGRETMIMFIRTEPVSMMGENDNLEERVRQIGQNLSRRLDKAENQGSGWSYDRVEDFIIEVTRFEPIKGSKFVQLPVSLRPLQSLINPRNDDDMCFLFCLAMSDHPPKDGHFDRIEGFRKYFAEYDVRGLNFPVSPTQVPIFEKRNGRAITILGFEGARDKGKQDRVYVISASTMPESLSRIFLLLLEEGHYVLIKNLRGFLNHFRKSRCYRYCDRCLVGLSYKSSYDKHRRLCLTHAAAAIRMPEQEKSILEFNAYKKCLRLPMVAYADFECILSKCVEGGSDRLHKHLPFCYHLLVIDFFGHVWTEVSYTGEDCVSHFLMTLFILRDAAKKHVLEREKPLVVSTQEREAILKQPECVICGKSFLPEEEKHIDHCHVTGEIRGATHSTCNLGFTTAKESFRVLIHNCGKYDLKLLLKGIADGMQGLVKDIHIIPRTEETFLTMKLNGITFLDSFQFLSCSLDKLVSSLGEEMDLTILKEAFPETTPEQLTLLQRKGYFPYEYITDMKILSETQLPPRENFFSLLKAETISEDQYRHAIQVWDTFHCKTIGDYGLLYCRVDTLLLATVFERFRRQTMHDFGLEACMFVSLPSLSMAAALKTSKVKLELVTNIDQHLMWEAGIRGGICVAPEKFSKANNIYMGSAHDENKESSFIFYFDCNSLYAYVMWNFKLPCGAFRFLDEEEVSQVKIHELRPEDETGYILDVDLEFPKEVHDRLQLLPPAPEVMEVTREMLSPYNRKQIYSADNPFSRIHLPSENRKLVAHLALHNHYVVHGLTLQLYLELGVQIKKIHQILSFQQKAWLRNYIEGNLQRRAQTTSKFEKDLYKLFSNAVYGKCLERVRSRKRIVVATSDRQLQKLARKPTFKERTIIGENLILVHQIPTQVTLDKPLFCGMSILDLSKKHMYQFLYGVLRAHFGDSLTLCYSDTDSVIIRVENVDAIEKLKAMKSHFDFSSLPFNHPLYSRENASRQGKFKDETGGKIISELVCLRPKMYSILFAGENEEQIVRAKGMNRNSRTMDILCHTKYTEALSTGRNFSVTNVMIRSEKLQLYTVEQKRHGLVIYDDKVYLYRNPNGEFKTLPYGHYRIAEIATEGKDSDDDDDDENDLHE
ncbi:unnamed protein product [Darwinula stevensoni]|uniref:DNA-directed DNA polymerase n=1 Tax=Darwinula stevensoni TaxID=69355 RepID=A0A7R8XAY9_9CRUS|nr:unnamed protein product [Darwinula stevensoni]CAG0892350.1 unnamed protein product [Darwinula stevensoni]